jgi:hypothetical protein
MKRLLLLAALFSACVSSTKETASDDDSVATGSYEDFSEVAPFTLKEDLVDREVSLNGKSKKLRDLLTAFYAPDPYTSKTPDDTIGTPSYIITDAQVVEGQFFQAGGKCGRRSIMFTTRGNFIDQEFYDILFLQEAANGEMAVVGKETLDGSQGQSSTTVWVKPAQLPVNDRCAILEVTSATEGGDINLKKNESVEYYIADEKMFHSILKLQLEDTSIQDYEATQDENQNSSSETRDVTFLGSSSNGLRDIRAHYISKQDGDTVADIVETYVFDGNMYIKK